jgi:hypothetical protein
MLEYWVLFNCAVSWGLLSPGSLDAGGGRR